MKDATRFEPELGARLRRIYGLEEKPKGPREFFRLIRAVSEKSSGTKDFLRIVKSGEAVIGASRLPTKDWIIGENGKKVFTYCSYDTLMTATLRSQGEIGSSCPHCGQTMKIRIEGAKLRSFSPGEMLFLWGTGPEGSPGNPMCDHLHLFPSREHMTEWMTSRAGELGFSLEISDAFSLLGNRF